MAQTVNIILSPSDRHRLERIANDPARPTRHGVRARIVLLSDERLSVSEVARRAGVSRAVVWRWQQRFAEEGVEGLLREKPRKPGKPRLEEAVVARIIALTRTEPPGGGAYWTGRAMAEATGVSLASVQRVWAAHALRPGRPRSVEGADDSSATAQIEGAVDLSAEASTDEVDLEPMEAVSAAKGQDMTTNKEALLFDLIDARKERQQWYRVAKVLHDLEKAGPTDEKSRPWISVAAEQSGYSTNQLRAMERTYRVLYEFSIKESEINFEFIKRWPFSSLSVIARIVSIDRAVAIDLLKGPNRGFLEIRDLYNGIRSKLKGASGSMSAGHLTAQAFRFGVMNSISGGDVMERISPHMSVLSQTPVLWPNCFRHAAPDAVVIGYADESIELVAIKCARIFGDVNLEQHTKVIQRAAFESTFFSKYYICVPIWSRVDLIKFDIKRLLLQNVGVIVVNDDFGIEDLWIPNDLPVPDRRSIILGSRRIRERLHISHLKNNAAMNDLDRYYNE